MKYKIRALDIKNRQEGMSEYDKIGVTVPGQKIMSEKLFPLAVKIKGLKVPAADILKQEMLARGGDVGTSRNTLIERSEKTDVIIEGSYKSFDSLIIKLKMQPFGLKELSAELETFLRSYKKNRRGKKYLIGSKKFNTGSAPLIMRILNATPDSFFDGGKYNSYESAVERAGKMIDEGADIIDIGGLSSRPGSKPVSPEEELERTIPLIKHIHNNFNVLISIDTYRSEVASKAVSAGADIINDISAFTMDEHMVSIAANSGTAVVLMHMRGTPEDMQDDPQYSDVVDEVCEYLNKRASYAVKSGISADKIIIDPGIGFGKTLEHNLAILNKIREFTLLGFPVLVGASRKSFMGKILDLPAEERLEGSLAAAVWAAINGVSILRVHDVAATARAVKMAHSIMNGY
ncbi:MAG: dihydropteroate synthase [Actinomycetia bacterium]|nr:dihydropteroate synthase [Actinomycetes bacterium]